MNLDIVRIYGPHKGFPFFLPKHIHIVTVPAAAADFESCLGFQEFFSSDFTRPSKISTCNEILQ